MLSVLSTYTITIEKDGVDVEIPLCQGIKYSILKYYVAKSIIT